jgi:hypothetical protein
MKFSPLDYAFLQGDRDHRFSHWFLWNWLGRTPEEACMEWAGGGRTVKIKKFSIF